MSVTSIGDLAQNFQLRRQVADAKARVTAQAQALTTGMVADRGDHLKGDYAPLAAVERDIDDLSSLSRAASEAGTFVSVAQAALSDLQGLGETVTAAMMTATSAGQYGALAVDARQSFMVAIDRLNVQAAGRSVFAGTATDGPAVVSAQDILAALDGAVAGLTGAADIAAAVDAWFDAGAAGYSGIGFAGSTTAPAFRVDGGAPASAGITADTAQIRDVLKGLAIGAMVNSAALSGSAAGAAQLARLSAERLLGATSALTELRAGLGTVENRIDSANTRAQTQRGALELVKSGMVAADPYEAATALEAAEGQLQTLYTLTARLSRLSLAEYL